MSTTTTRAVEAAMRLAEECKLARGDADLEFAAKVNEDYGIVQRELTRLRAALDDLDSMQPEDYKTGQDHLSPAFRTVNFQDALEHVATVVNGVLHGTDAYGRPLPDQQEKTDD